MLFGTFAIGPCFVMETNLLFKISPGPVCKKSAGGELKRQTDTLKADHGNFKKKRNYFLLDAGDKSWSIQKTPTFFLIEIVFSEVFALLIQMTQIIMLYSLSRNPFLTWIWR